MRFLIINYRYFISGGPERYMFNLVHLLEAHGNQVIPFSITYKQNVKSDYESYFATPLSSIDEVTFKDQSWNLKSFLKTVERSFYSVEVYKKLSSLIIDTKPDYAIVLHYLRKLSPAVIKSLHDHKIPFVVRLSDFGMICANSHFLKKNQVCQLCINGGIIHGVINKCVQDSYAASFINYTSIKYHNLMHFFDMIPKIISPSKFTLSKMIESGWEENRIIHIPTFVQEFADINDISSTRHNQVVFIGRIDVTKGIHILLEAFNFIQKELSNNDLKCIIIGKGDPEYIAMLERYIECNNVINIEFYGFLQKNEINNIIKESYATIVPSIWYENSPNIVLESLALGTPVIASELGSLRELIIHGKNGLLFEPNNSIDLANKILNLICDYKMPELAMNSQKSVRINHSPEFHYNLIMETLKSIDRQQFV